MYTLLARVRQNSTRENIIFSSVFFPLCLRASSLEKKERGENWLKDRSTLTVDDANVLLFPFCGGEVKAADDGGATGKFGLLRGPHKSFY